MHNLNIYATFIGIYLLFWLHAQVFNFTARYKFLGMELKVRISNNLENVESRKELK